MFKKQTKMSTKATVIAFIVLIAVHSSGAIRPATTKDSQLKCGSVLCQVVSEIFSKAKLNYGYNYVTTIPAGAMNLTIKQLSRSDNLMALKTTDEMFIINGNHRASDSGIFEYNEDVYDYNRELGTITAKGPLTKPIVLLLLARGYNPGIKYDYTIPIPSNAITEEEEQQSEWNELGQPIDEIDDNNIENVSGGSNSDAAAAAQLSRSNKERKRRKFSWKLLGFGQCNRSCGPGVQQPIFRCIRDSPTRFYTPKRCAFIEKPVFSEDIYQCNRGLCPAYWRAGDYSECNCENGAEEGVRRRIVRCVQEQITGKVEDVAEKLCSDNKLPELTETCNCPKLMRRRLYARGPEKAARVYSRLIGAPPLVRHIHNNTVPLRRHLRDDRNDKNGVWLMSDWNKECSVGCGIGFEHRSIYCDRTPPYTGLCDLRYTPEQKRKCSTGVESDCSEGIWFASEWSNCTGDCFSMQRKRLVVCLKNGVVTNDDVCANLKKPIDVMNCTMKEVNYCGPQWHYSEWSECSRTCGEGIQRRYAKCLEYDLRQNALVESNNCKYVEREPVYGACNLQKCDELNAAASGDVDDAQSVECNDEYSSCKMINSNQHLCKVPYFKNNCCASCQVFNE